MSWRLDICELVNFCKVIYCRYSISMGCYSFQHVSKHAISLFCFAYFVECHGQWFSITFAKNVIVELVLFAGNWLGTCWVLAIVECLRNCKLFGQELYLAGKKKKKRTYSCVSKRSPKMVYSCVLKMQLQGWVYSRVFTKTQL